MGAHAFILAALVALTAAVGVGQHSAQIDGWVDQLASPHEWTVLPVCSNVELTVACMPLTDIPSEQR
jgi:hypothetical protein